MSNHWGPKFTLAFAWDNMESPWHQGLGAEACDRFVCCGPIENRD
jgi:hypothetical protein